MDESIDESVVSELPSEKIEMQEENEMPGLMPESGHTHIHPEHESGNRWLDVIVAVSVIFISVVSLVVSINHGKTMEKMVEQNQKMVDQNQKLVVANTLPLLTVGGNNWDPVANKPQSRLILANEGVGPAIIQKFEFRYKGVAYEADTNALLKACCALAMGNPNRQVLYGNVSGTILPTRDPTDLILVQMNDPHDKLVQAFETARNDIRFHACYCLVLDECWETDFDRSKRPTPVKECKIAPGEKLW
jgi:hypothetical protein